MSRYSDKHHSKARCSEQDCITPAEKLVLVGSVPKWFCPLHGDLQPQRSA